MLQIWAMLVNTSVTSDAISDGILNKITVSFLTMAMSSKCIDF